jgi:hypothetical protein
LRHPSEMLAKKKKKSPARVARIYKEKYQGTVCPTLELCARMTLVLGSASLFNTRPEGGGSYGPINAAVELWFGEETNGPTGAGVSMCRNS